MTSKSLFSVLFAAICVLFTAAAQSLNFSDDAHAYLRVVLASSDREVNFQSRMWFFDFSSATKRPIYANMLTHSQEQGPVEWAISIQKSSEPSAEDFLVSIAILGANGDSQARQLDLSTSETLLLSTIPSYLPILENFSLAMNQQLPAYGCGEKFQQEYLPLVASVWEAGTISAIKQELDSYGVSEGPVRDAEIRFLAILYLDQIADEPALDSLLKGDWPKGVDPLDNCIAGLSVLRMQRDRKDLSTFGAKQIEEFAHTSTKPRVQMSEWVPAVLYTKRGERPYRELAGRLALKPGNCSNNLATLIRSCGCTSIAQSGLSPTQAAVLRLRLQVALKALDGCQGVSGLTPPPPAPVRSPSP